MSYETQYSLATNAGFIQRVAMGLLDVRRDILNESPSEPDHTARLAWANSFVDTNAATNEALACIIFLVANPTLEAKAANPSSILDSEIEYSIIQDALPQRIK